VKYLSNIDILVLTLDISLSSSNFLNIFKKFITY
jgi:hypothetical protein